MVIRNIADRQFQMETAIVADVNRRSSCKGNTGRNRSTAVGGRELRLKLVRHLASRVLVDTVTRAVICDTAGVCHREAQRTYRNVSVGKHLPLAVWPSYVTVYLLEFGNF